MEFVVIDVVFGAAVGNDDSDNDVDGVVVDIANDAVLLVFTGHDGIILLVIIIRILSEYYYEAKIWWVLINILSYNTNNNKTFYRGILGILVVNAIYF